MKLRDLSGEVFGRLTVLPERESRNKRTYWKCKCSCGNVKWIWADSLWRGTTGSCGCLFKERVSEKNKSHGMSGSPEYSHWIKIKARCLNEKDKCYQKYGARGITMQAEWVNDFMAFYNHIGPKPEGDERYSVDRIDNNQGYKEGNVRWATPKDQARNRGKRSTNTSGITGVRKMKVPSGSGWNVYWQATWYSLEEKQECKLFPVLKYGDKLAKELAIDFRNKKIQEMNAMGAGYTENYGK